MIIVLIKKKIMKNYLVLAKDSSDFMSMRPEGNDVYCFFEGREGFIETHELLGEDLPVISGIIITDKFVMNKEGGDLIAEAEGIIREESKVSWAKAMSKVTHRYSERNKEGRTIFVLAENKKDFEDFKYNNYLKGGAKKEDNIFWYDDVYKFRGTSCDMVSMGKGFYLKDIGGLLTEKEKELKDKAELYLYERGKPIEAKARPTLRMAMDVYHEAFNAGKYGAALDAIELIKRYDLDV